MLNPPIFQDLDITQSPGPRLWQKRADVGEQEKQTTQHRHMDPFGNQKRQSEELEPKSQQNGVGEGSQGIPPSLRTLRMRQRRGVVENGDQQDETRGHTMCFGSKDKLVNQEKAAEGRN